MGTHISQRSPELMENEARDFMADTRLDLIGEDRHQDYIINMDQAGHWSLVGNELSTSEKAQMTPVELLLLIRLRQVGRLFGQFSFPNGCIVTSELPTFSNDILYACQTNAWMDEVVMRMWVERVLAPHVATAPPRTGCSYSLFGLVSL